MTSSASPGTSTQASNASAQRDRSPASRSSEDMAALEATARALETLESDPRATRVSATAAARTAPPHVAGVVERRVRRKALLGDEAVTNPPGTLASVRWINRWYACIEGATRGASEGTRLCRPAQRARVGVGVVAAAFESTRANDVAGAKRALSSTRKITSRAQTLAPSLAGATVTGARRARPRGRRAWTRCCASSPSASGHARVSRSDLAFAGRHPARGAALVHPAGRPRPGNSTRPSVFVSGVRREGEGQPVQIRAPEPRVETSGRAPLGGRAPAS